ncbi:MAG: hypothetical protein HXY25_00505 [Alphaproteobacteria bacterium]|nr:hypothetical protein [Alphaproteobacteria bacterium]
MTRSALAIALALGLAAGAAAPAFAMHCPADMKQIDAALAAGPELTEEQLARVKELRAEGEALHKAGNHKGSVEKLGEAKKILGLE